ncbi:MAG: hypothetical protein CL933_06030 [Deltaproteobacteria bacterium]|nr:hypothetical protein [Deltaproteobacteria bacterium]
MIGEGSIDFTNLRGLGEKQAGVHRAPGDLSTRTNEEEIDSFVPSRSVSFVVVGPRERRGLVSTAELQRPRETAEDLVFGIARSTVEISTDDGGPLDNGEVPDDLQELAVRTALFSFGRARR